MEPKNVRLPLRVGLPFAALAIGFLGAVLYVPLALRPLTARAEVIQHELAESVRLLSGVRGYARDVRSEALLLAYETRRDPAFDRGPHVQAIAAGRAQLREYAAAYARLPRGDAEDAIWRRVRDADLPALDQAVDRTLATAVRPEADPGALRNLLEAGSSLDDRLRRLGDINVTATQEDTSEIHDDMRRLSIAYVVLAALGALGALLLVPQIVRLLRTYETSVASRLTELDAFAGQISHDLRTPLQTIHLAVHTIEKMADHPESVREIAARAAGGVRRLDAMIQDLLQFARSGAPASEEGRSDVQEVVEELARELAGHAERANVRLSVRAVPVAARIPPVALKAVLSNLLENAIKYRKPDVENHVVVTAEAQGDEVRLRIEDTGVGIAPNALPHVFEPFFRGTRRPDSYGLGLATVKRLVESHRGTIAVHSKEGRGTTFDLRLPRAAERPPHAATEALGRADQPDPGPT
jgi:signal transduction histidine kinase